MERLCAKDASALRHLTIGRHDRHVGGELRPHDGGIAAFFPALIGDFFGRLAIGAIVGFIFALAGSPAAFGPLIAGYMYDATKSYNGTLC
jgi:hypothetical protein